jgi:DNA-binding CsgD family transcriptional regulator
LSGRVAWASDLLAAGSGYVEARGMHADFKHLSAVVERLVGSAQRSHEILWDAAAAVAPEDPGRAVVMMIDATTTDIMIGDLDAAAGSGRRACTFAGPCAPALRRLAAYAADTAAAYRGELPPGDLGTESAIVAAASLELPPLAAAAIDLSLTRGLVTEGQLEPLGILEGAIREARESGALGKLPFILGHGAHADFLAGRWTRARSRAAEAVELAGPTAYRAWALVHLARVAAAEGREEECRAAVAEAFSLAHARGHRSLDVHLLSVLGLLELGIGNIPTAIEHLMLCARKAKAEGLGNPATVPYEADLVEALHAGGRHEEAWAALEPFQQCAERVGSAWARAAAARCRAVLASEDAFESEFRSALDLQEPVVSSFELARTQLCFGERLRRLRRKREAQTHLLPALMSFEDLGATGWANRARKELMAAGFSAQPPRANRSLERLTPQELRVGLLIAEGASVREAATQLFLSPKTIEAHLGRVYQKLGVHNRAQLTRSLGDRQSS